MSERSELTEGHCPSVAASTSASEEAGVSERSERTEGHCPSVAASTSASEEAA